MQASSRKITNRLIRNRSRPDDQVPAGSDACSGREGVAVSIQAAPRDSEVNQDVKVYLLFRLRRPSSHHAARDDSDHHAERDDYFRAAGRTRTLRKATGP